MSRPRPSSKKMGFALVVWGLLPTLIGARSPSSPWARRLLQKLPHRSFSRVPVGPGFRSKLAPCRAVESLASTAARRPKPPLHVNNIGAKAILVGTGCVCKTVLGALNSVKVHYGERLEKAVEHRPNGTGLFTVSNHASMLDPAVIAAMYPWQEKDLTQWPPWTLCTDSFFKIHPMVEFWLSSGKAMPITRASPKGLRQEYLRAFRDRLDAGEWCHLYPEGKITQPWRFEPGQSRLGKFLPGVGKLITSCQKTPMVVPVYHKGMHNIMPEVQGDRKLPAKPVSLVPKGGKHVDVYIGEPIDLSDILEADHDPEDWNKETKEDLRLWLKISHRIREAMQILEREAWGDRNFKPNLSVTASSSKLKL